MAHGFLQSFDKNLTVCSAGTQASGKLNEKAVAVMKEVGVDISHHTSDSVEKYLNEEWDYVITVCGGANEACPAFFGKVKHRMHIGFDDPSHATGTDEFIWSEFVRVRDEIKEKFYSFYVEQVKPQLMDSKDLKLAVKSKYSEIAKQAKPATGSSCCGPTGCCSTVDYSVFNESYEQLEGYNPDADLNLGCGIPTQFADIREGDHVLDLGSGAGNDCFVARAIVGETGKVTGLDFTDAMLEKANENVKRLGYTNIDFVKGDIENMPLPDEQFGVVVSNCVLNLVPNKRKAFAEIMRVLKPGGHFCVSDVVIKGVLPEKLQKDAEMYAGCVSGAIGMDEYLAIIDQQGFIKVAVHKQKEITLPYELLVNYLSDSEIERYHHGENGIYSVTVSGYKQQKL
jgi:SAM-dependent methyltransferase/protein-tyrosine-phosphatase